MAETLTRRAPGIYETANKNVFRLVVSGGLEKRTGKYPQLWSTWHGNFTTAVAERNRLMAEVKDGKRKVSTATVNEMFDAWLEDLPILGRAPRTIRSYRADAKAYWRTPIGKKKVSSVTKDDIRDVVRGLTKRGLAAATVRRVHSCVSAAFIWGAEEDYLRSEHSPVDDIRLPALTDRAPNVPTAETVRLVIEEALASRMPEMARFVFLGAVTGCRSSELRALRLDQIDLERGNVGIVAAMSDEVEWTTKNRHVRSPAIDAATVQVIREQIAFMQDSAVPHPLPPDAFLFSDTEGRTAWKAEKVTRSVSCFFDHAGANPHVEGETHDVLEPCPNPGPRGDFTFKHLRKFATTYARRLGFSSESVAERHGHDRGVADKAYAGKQEEATDRAISAGLAGLLIVDSPGT